MEPRTILGAFLCVLVGIIVGRLLPVGDRSQEENHEVPERFRQSVDKTRKVSGRPEQEWPRTARRERVETGTDAESAVADKGMVWVPSSLLAELSGTGGSRTAGQSLFGGDGKIDEMLGVTDHEKANIQKAWKGSQERIRKLEASSMKSEESEDGTVTITVPDLSEGQGKIGEEFGEEVKRNLGGNRSEVFLAVKQVGRMFSPEPGERTYRIRAESAGDGKWRFHMTLEGSGERRVWVSDTIPAEISHLTDVANIRRSLAE